MPAETIGQRRRGRPPGSKNKPKDSNVAAQRAILDLRKKVGPFLPSEDMDYLEGILEGSDEPELQRDLDIFLALQLKALLPQLADEIRTGQLTREATQRSSTVKELLALRFQMEKHEKGDDNTNQYTFIQNIFNSRGLDTDRIAALAATVTPVEPSSPPRLVSGPLSRSADGDEGEADEVGAVPDSVPQRPE